MQGSGEQQAGWQDSLPELIFFLFIIAAFLVAVGWFVYLSLEVFEDPEEGSAREVIAQTVEEVEEPEPEPVQVQVEFPYFNPARVLNNPECRVRVA